MVEDGYLNPKIELKQSELQGKGLFTKEHIKKGEVITDDSLCDMDYIDKAEADKLYDQGYDMLWQVAKNKFYSAHKEKNDYDAMYMNHSCEPNAGFQGVLKMVAMCDIKAGEEITFDYAMSESTNFEMDCNCRQKMCRKTIVGDDWKNPSLQERYKGYFIKYIQDQINQQ